VDSIDIRSTLELKTYLSGLKTRKMNLGDVEAATDIMNLITQVDALNKASTQQQQRDYLLESKNDTLTKKFKYQPVLSVAASLALSLMAELGVTTHTCAILDTLPKVLSYLENQTVSAEYRSNAQITFIGHAATLTHLSQDDVVPHFKRINQFRKKRNNQQHPSLSKEILNKKEIFEIKS
jgi:hypothetical protein